MVALAFAACGRVDSSPDDSPLMNGTGGVDAAGGSGAGSSEAGGDTTDPTTGGTSAGGLVGQLPGPWGPCHREYVGLEPPCSDSDVSGLLSSCGLWFDVPLTHVAPPALGLRVVLLPLASSAGGNGFGGMAGLATEPLRLEPIFVSPKNPPWESGETFDVLEPASYVRAGHWDRDLPPGYVADPPPALGPDDAWYGVAEVALVQGTETLSVHRGLFGGTPDGICVK